MDVEINLTKTWFDMLLSHDSIGRIFIIDLVDCFLMTIAKSTFCRF